MEPKIPLPEESEIINLKLLKEEWRRNRITLTQIICPSCHRQFKLYDIIPEDEFPADNPHMTLTCPACKKENKFLEWSLESAKYNQQHLNESICRSIIKDNTETIEKEIESWSE